MGTRNITSVVLNGKQVVCQYGQWDGYPSYTGVKILEFLRDCDMDRFQKALENTTIHVSSMDDATTYTGSTKQLSDISEKVFKTQVALYKNRKGYINGFEAVHRMLKKGTITEQSAEDYLVGTRDTGCDILKLIYDRSLDKPPLELFALSDEYNGQYSWDIQGVYVLDLDNNTVQMTYDGYSQKYDISNLPAEIEKEMLVFEKATRELYEPGYGKENVTSAAEKDPGVLYRKASEIALKIGEEIKTEYPKLVSASDQTIAAESFGHTMIYRFLCEKNGLQPETLKPFEELVASAEGKRTLSVASRDDAPTPETSRDC